MSGSINVGAPKQDMPPQGGYPAISYRRQHTPPRFSGFMKFAIAGAVMAGGLLVTAYSQNERRNLDREKVLTRIALVPLLQAEEDRRFLREYKKYLEDEEKIMAGVPGWKVGERPYNTDRWVPPAEPPIAGTRLR
eukprot:Clim_evm48s232 gene=Clim_evmTU48s232